MMIAGVGFLLAFLITPVVIWLYRRLDWIEDPKKLKHVKTTHSSPVPRGGGVVIFMATVIGCGLFLNLDKYLLAILCSALVLMIVGVWDDVGNIHPYLRLVAGVIAALIVVGSGIGIAYVTNPFGSGVIHLDQPRFNFEIAGETHSLWVLSSLFAIIFIVWNMNIVNWSKGVDGQMPGFVSIAFLFIGLLSQRFVDDPSQFGTAQLAFLLSGVFAGFLVWNIYPQKIMPGYGAGCLAGFFLSVLSILSGAKIATTLMVLSIPTADAIFTITRRILSGKSPFWGDRGHLHHKLLDVLGWGRRRVAVFYWLSSALMGVLSLYLNTLGKLITIAVACLLVFGFLIWAKLKTIERKSHKLLLHKKN